MTNYYFMGESLETSVPWSKLNIVMDKVQAKIVEMCKERKINENYIFASYRVT